MLGRVTNGCHVEWDTNTDTDDHLDDPDNAPRRPGSDGPGSDHDTRPTAAGDTLHLTADRTAATTATGGMRRR